MEKKGLNEQPHFTIPIHVEFERYLSGELCALESIDSNKFYDNSDFDTIASICGQKLVYDFLFKDRFKGRPYTQEDAKGFISWAQEGWRRNEYFVFLIRNSKSEIVAAVDIKSNNLKSAEMGYWSSSETPGVMTNAVASLCKIAKQAGFCELFGLTVPDNIRSQNVLIRAGFTNEGHLEREDKRYFKFSKSLE